MHAAHASNSSKASASVTSKRESLAGRQTKTVQETIPKGQIYTSNCQPLCGGRPSGPATNGHVHKPRGRQRRHNHRPQTSNRSIYKAISKDCRHKQNNLMGECIQASASLCAEGPAVTCTYPRGVIDGTITEQKLASQVYTKP